MIGTGKLALQSCVGPVTRILTKGMMHLCSWRDKMCASPAECRLKLQPRYGMSRASLCNM